MLWRQFRQLGLLPLQECADTECSSWLQHLQEKPVLLPAHLSLVEAPGWRQAALQAVPAPELLQESLWLLHHREDSEQERIQLLHSHLRERIRLDRAEQPHLRAAGAGLSQISAGCYSANGPSPRAKGEQLINTGALDIRRGPSFLNLSQAWCRTRGL